MSIRIEARQGHELVKYDSFGGLYSSIGTSLTVKNNSITLDHGRLRTPHILEEATYHWRVDGYEEGGMVGKRLINAGERWVTRKGPIFIGE